MRQKWGQNFLTDAHVAERIVGALGAVEGQRVLEIGPGRGILTQVLVQGAADITAVELDRNLAAGLAKRWPGYPKLNLVNQDFLEWPLPPWPDRTTLVVSNLPYSVGNAILQKLLDWKAWKLAVVMLQKEVAARLLARPRTRDYGILTLAVQGKVQVEKLFDVARGSFTPAPRVQSTVLRLTPLAQPLIRNEPQFFRVIHAAFGQRRKTLSNALSHGLALPKPEVDACLASLGIDPMARAETLPLDQFNQLADSLPLS
jgi:16S rRNA (adenine1518-N6/adenine1519-N6)-dimethyltransferase